MQTIFILALVGLLVGFSKGGLGGPVPVSLTAPLLSLVFPVSKAIGMVLPLLIFADLFALYFYWKKWDMRYVRLLLPAAVIGVICGTRLLTTLPDHTLRPILGIFTLIAVVYRLANEFIKSLTYSPQTWHGYLAGWASGFGSSLANVGAPPFTAYMLLQPEMTPITFIGTTTLFFAIVNLLKLPGFLSSGVLDLQQLLSILWIAPIIPFGVWAGRELVRRIDAKLFEYLMLALLFILSLSLIFT
ncbi:MAG TPA: sulfite exporter TauE/SafE family protein [Phototrophicaceae bacterium]|jgi:hypothetical protein|nr:sulfite exporter TauE/SafE family protein [Phototrophicaceae bacterium]